MYQDQNFRAKIIKRLEKTEKKSRKTDKGR